MNPPLVADSVSVKTMSHYPSCMSGSYHGYCVDPYGRIVNIHSMPKREFIWVFKVSFDAAFMLDQPKMQPDSVDVLRRKVRSVQSSIAYIIKSP